MDSEAENKATATGPTGGSRRRKSIFRKTALIFVIASLAPALILGINSYRGFQYQLERTVSSGGMSAEEAATYQHDRTTFLLTYGGYGIMIVLVLSYFFASSIVKPIRLLQQGARRIGEGELDHRVHTGADDELEELAITINQMADSLQVREAEIEARNRHLTILYELTHALAETRDLDEIKECTLKRLDGIMYSGAVTSSLLLKDRQGKLGTVECHYSAGGCDSPQPASIFSKSAAAAMRTGEPVIADYGDQCCDSVFETIAAVPLKVENVFQGALCIAGARSDFSRENLELLGAIATEVAFAIEKADLFMKMEEQNRELAMATFEIANLIKEAELHRSFSVRYQNPNLVKCWEMKGCTRYSCPAHGSDDHRCWQISGTLCEPENGDDRLDQMEICEKCEVYQAVLSDRITVLGETFNNMMAVLEKHVSEQDDLQRQLYNSSKLAAIGELAAGTAHEINNPLTGILANAMMLKTDPGDSETMNKRLSVIEEEALRARDIVRNLLDFARQGDMQTAPVAISGLVGHTLSLIGHQADLSSVEIETDFPEDLPEVTIDQNQIKQVFMNIVHNALHAMKDGGRLSISADVAAGPPRRQMMEIRFTDTGSGMDTETLERIFDPFYTTKPAGEGTGLGLSISQRIANEHGGEILVESKPGKGSSFIVALPMLRSLSSFSENVA